MDPSAYLLGVLQVGAKIRSIDASGQGNVYFYTNPVSFSVQAMRKSSPIWLFRLLGTAVWNLELSFSALFTALLMENGTDAAGPKAYSAQMSRIMWAKSLAESIRSAIFTRSSAPWRWVSNPGMVQPKATPPGISWT